MINIFKGFLFCPLCGSLAKKIDEKHYYKCFRCGGVFLDKKHHLSHADEKKRYELHNSDVLDLGHRDFVFPITSEVLNEQKAENIGLDFGCGNGPIVSAVLSENKYNIEQYDPFFANNKELLEKKYDYIVCSEVVEHFNKPKGDFYILKRLLKPKATLYIMTDLLKDEVDFASWYYRKDPTHVFIYSKKTFKYIKKKFAFSSLSIKGRLVKLS